MATSTFTGLYLDPGPISGGTVRAWLTSRFASKPGPGDGVPAGTADATATSAANGTYTLTVPQDDNYYVSHEATGHARTWTQHFAGPAYGVAAMLRNPPGAVTGYVLTATDAQGTPSWQATSGGSAASLEASFTNPTTQTFGTTVNIGSATLTNSSGRIVLRTPGTGSGTQLRMWFKARPTAPYTVIVRLKLFSLMKNYHGVGIALRDSGGGKILATGLSAGYLMVNNFTSATLFSATVTAQEYTALRDIWVKLVDDNTDHKVSYSTNGIDWMDGYAQQGRTVWLPSAGDQIGIWVTGENNDGVIREGAGAIYSWAESSP